MSVLTQILAVSWLSLRTIPQRLRLVGRGGRRHRGRGHRVCRGAVDGAGLLCGDDSAGAPDRALVMRSGADRRDDAAAWVAPRPTSSSRRPACATRAARAFAAAELFVLVDLPKKTTGTPANVPMRGIDSTTLGGAQRGEDRRRPDAAVRHERGRSSAGRRCVSSPACPSVRRSRPARPRGSWSGSSSRAAASPKPSCGATRASFRARIAAATRYQSVSRQARLAAVVRRVQGLADIESAAERLGAPRGRVLRCAVDDADPPDSHRRLRDRRADGHRRGVSARS